MCGDDTNNLSIEQERCADHIAGLAGRSERFQPVLLHGFRGSGKRTVAKRVAEILNLDFDSISMADSRADIMLFGSKVDAARGQDGGPAPGLFGSTRPTLLYLTEFQEINSVLGNKLRIALREGYYTDYSGGRWFLDRKLLLVGAYLEEDERATIALDSFIVSGFTWKMRVEVPTGDDLRTIVLRMWRNLCPDSDLPSGVEGLLGYVQSAPAHLASLRAWLGIIVGELRRGEQPDDGNIADIPLRDLQYIMKAVSYAGRSFDISLLRKWLLQFPEPARPLLLGVVRHIGTRYYVSEAEYYRLLRRCIGQSQILARSRISFLTFEALGKSNPLVAHQLKTQGGWQPQAEVRLNDPPSWPTFDRDPEWLILADDFVGTGQKLGELVTLLPELFAKYPHSKLRVLVVIAFKSGLLKVEEALRPWGEQAALILGDVLDESDTCFGESSRILTSDAERALLKETCRQVAESYFPGLLQDDSYLGYGGLGAITVLNYSIPNNSLPILWFDRSNGWQPLFPRSGWHLKKGQ